MKIFSHEVIQKQWASIDYRKNMSVIALVQKGGHQEIIGIASYAMDEPDRAEVAFVVREDYQGKGVASFLLDILEKIARENDYKGFSATVLRENQTMIHIFKKKYPNAKISASSGSDIQILMDFEDIKHDKLNEQ